MRCVLAVIPHAERVMVRKGLDLIARETGIGKGDEDVLGVSQFVGSHQH
jgi:hypothetical protein